MSEGDLDFLGHGYWRKRIHQIKQEFRSAAPEQSLTIPEQAKPYGTELKPKRDLDSGKPTIPKSEIASPPPRRQSLQLDAPSRFIAQPVGGSR